MDIQIVDVGTLDNVIATRQPQGLFLARDGEVWVAVDNNTGDAWTEEFYTKELAVKWLREAETYR